MDKILFFPFFFSKWVHICRNDRFYCCSCRLNSTGINGWVCSGICSSISLISLSGYMSFPTHKSMWLQPCSVSLHTALPPHTKAPNRSFASFHSIHSFRPALAFSNANVRAKKCAKLAAGSTQPPRSALPVSGAFAPLAAARTQRTGLILRSVSLLSHLSLAINASSRLFLPRKFGLNPLLPRQPPTTHP